MNDIIYSLYGLTSEERKIIENYSGMGSNINDDEDGS